MADELKNISVNEKIWQALTLIKMRKGHKNFSETLEYLLKNMNLIQIYESIKIN